MNKTDIVRIVSNNLGINEYDITYIFDEIFKTIKSNLLVGKIVKIQHFASFTFRKPSYKTRMIHGKLIECKVKRKLVFTPSMEIKKSLEK